jgi:hypothetical protein
VHLNHLLIYEGIQVGLFELKLCEVRTHPISDPLVLEIRRVDQLFEHFGSVAEQIGRTDRHLGSIEGNKPAIF